MTHTLAHRQRLLARIRRIAGQVAAIERAVDAEAGCAVVLHQVAGVRGAIGGLMGELMEEHLREHVAQPGLSDAERASGAEELAILLQRYGK